jgi:MFS family permease
MSTSAGTLGLPNTHRKGVDLTVVLVALTALIAISSAIRSTWSPCGLSMLSTITPMAEAGRGHRFRTTAAWFLIGSVIGGATLGALMALMGVGIGALQVSSSSVLWIVGVAALVAAASDGRVAGFHLPGHDRQVNERWLDRYRYWVYGAGFGWQIGVGLATYIMTAGLYLLIFMGAAADDPLIAIGLGTLFGLVRGLAVYLAADLTTREKLLRFHARFEALREPVRRAMIVIQALVAVGAVWLANSGPALVPVAVVASIVVALSLRGPRESVEAPSGVAPAGAWS